MPEDKKKKRKMVTVKDERSGSFREFPLEPTTFESIKEGFEASATRANLSEERKRKRSK